MMLQRFYQVVGQINATYAWVLLSFIIIYIVYYWLLSQPTFKIKGKSNPRLKNIGKPPPAYPNGWYITMPSKNLSKGQSKSVDIAGENLVVFRSTKGQVYALDAYCKHIGANLGIGGQVINDKCIQCPFHGWLYDGETGMCVDYNGQPIKGNSIEYNDDFCKKGGKLEWKQQKEEKIKQRKYPIQQVNNFIYVWIHALEEYQENPQYPILNIESIINKMDYRGKTVHDVMCHPQDIPENGADIYHFKFVHSYIIPFIKSLHFTWKAKWKRGDDPDIKEMFEHQVKYIRDFKQSLYKDFIENYPDRRWLSIGFLDNYLHIPILGDVFMFNATVIQIGSGIVYIFVKFPTHLVVFFHYLQPQQRHHQIVYHQAYVSKWIPYWISALSINLEGGQVTNDMYVWDRKKFARKVYYKQSLLADEYIRQWRKWYSQNYQGCLQKEQKLNQNSW